MRSLCLLVALSLPSAAQAFCGFFVAGNDAKLYNNASQVVLLRDGNRTVMTLQNSYQGPPEDFAMVVPVPVVLHKEDVKTLPANVFDHIDALSAPRLVEYWERDPCAPQIFYKPSKGGRGGVDFEDGAMPDERAKHGVKIEAQFVVGEYEILILSAKESKGLELWLKENHYKIPDGADAALAPYVREQSKFFVAKVDIKKVKKDEHGKVTLSPLRFGFESSELRLPVRLGLLNAKDKQDLIVYVLHPKSRFETANYANVFVPTNLEVADQVRRSFPSFYAQLFDATLAAHKRAVVTEYAWQTDSCDPCPTPPLDASDVATLGGDEKSSAGLSSWVLTRLHARYDRASLSEDLVFKEARPAEGGRSIDNGSSTGPEVNVTDAGVNNFQARYIIRHYWTKKVTCENPRWGEWGGPPDGDDPGALPAKGLADAPRGQVKLHEVVRTPVPALKLAGRPAPVHRTK